MHVVVAQEFTIPAKKTGDIQQLDPECLDPTDNLVKLNDLNEALILHNLKLRFKKDVIYTYGKRSPAAC